MFGKVVCHVVSGTLVVCRENCRPCCFHMTSTKTVETVMSMSATECFCVCEQCTRKCMLVLPDDGVSGCFVHTFSFMCACLLFCNFEKCCAALDIRSSSHSYLNLH